MSERTCENCGKKLHGRSDKKFCSTECKNEFNYAKSSAVTNEMRRVNRILAKNRSILEELNPKGKSKANLKKLKKAGFDFNYVTSIYETKNGNTYYFCYEQGYLQLDNDWYALVVKQEYAE